MNLAGRIVLLTGGSRGLLGPVVAERLARQGAHLALVARSVEPLQAVCASLQALGVRAVGFSADVARAEERERLVEQVMREFGRVDVLVNNAGVENGRAFADLGWDEIQHVIDVNLSAPVHLTHLLLPSMLERREGHLVQIASLAAKVGMPYDAIYSGTKAGLARWSQGLRRETEGAGVGISIVMPGYVTERGMFAKFGLRPPTLVGSSTPAQVATAVEEAILRNRPEVIVNSLPMSPAIAMSEMFPAARDWLLRRLGVVEFQHRKAGTPPAENPL